MSSYLKDKHEPCILSEDIYYFTLSLPEYTGIERQINLPYIYNSNMYVYSIHLFHALIRVLSCCTGQLLSKSPTVFARTELTEMLLSPIVDAGYLKWELYYKDSKDRKNKPKKEVSLENIKRFYKHVIKHKVEIHQDCLPIYIRFLEEERNYLEIVEKHLQSSGSEHTAEEIPQDYELSLVIPEESDIGRFKEIMRNVPTDGEIHNINYEDFW
eukprot:TRINITY_DN8553_c0_g1_i1.p1 TRINITY_DN8553_c0_g1~~TRINITY_DN8553_c0_g1_i1.p1  ORF type:complete len:213 (-),score=11.78 TRINITY_DN8553_c0_g1_i1:625-1263(-)